MNALAVSTKIIIRICIIIDSFGVDYENCSSRNGICGTV